MRKTGCLLHNSPRYSGLAKCVKQDVYFITVPDIVDRPSAQNRVFTSNRDVNDTLGIVSP